MSTIKIYRYEDAGGKGPYTSAKAPTTKRYQQWRFDRHTIETHPGIMWDVVYFDRSMQCATDSLEKLMMWFDGVQDDLKDAGFKVIEYEIPAQFVQFGKSGRQVAAPLSSAVGRKVVEL